MPGHNHPSKEADSEFEKTAKSPPVGAAPIPKASLIPDRAWKIAQLAAILASRHPHIWRQHGGYMGDESDSSSDFFYNGLLERAWFLLSRAEEIGIPTYAHELFVVGKRYTVDEIAGIFAAAGWRKLTTKPSVRKLLRLCKAALEECFKSHSQHIINHFFDGKDPGPSGTDKANPQVNPFFEEGTRQLRENVVWRSMTLEAFEKPPGAHSRADSFVSAFHIFYDCVERSLMLDQLHRPLPHRDAP